jgi:hypothetical protein
LKEWLSKGTEGHGDHICLCWTTKWYDSYRHTNGQLLVWTCCK